MKKKRRSAQRSSSHLELIQNVQTAPSYPELITLGDDKIEEEDFQNGLAKLVLTVAKLLLEIIERQAYRAVVSGSLSDEEVERLGNALIKARQELAQMLEKFGLSHEELNRSIGKLLGEPAIQRTGDSLNLTPSSIVTLIDRIIEKETTIAGQVTVSLAGVDLIVLNLLAAIQPSRLLKARNRDG
jgi:hypothetical protein